MKKALLLILPVLILGFNCLQAGAYYVPLYDESNEDNPNVDVFKPQSGVKIKPSPFAQMMENATQKAVDKQNSYKNQQQKQQQNKPQANTWF